MRSNDFHWDRKWVTANEPQMGISPVLYVDADMAIRNTHVICEQAIEFQRTFQPHWFGIEANQFQQLLADDIRQLADERRIFLPLYTLDNRISTRRRK